MIYLEVSEVIDLHDRIITQSGGSAGIRDFGLLQSAIAQPQMTFGGADLYPSIELKAAAIAFSLVHNHPFVDGNKRIGHAAMEALVCNGFEIDSPVEEQEATILDLAAENLSRQGFEEWVASHIVARK